MIILMALHSLAAVIWVGGMFFAYQILRPVAAELLEAAPRQNLWVGVFQRFFFWVWLAIGVLPISGLVMIMAYGGMDRVGFHVHAMIATGIVMMLLFLHVYFVPFKRLKRAVQTQDYQAGGKSLNQIRLLVGINTFIGLITIVIAVTGRLVWISLD